MSLYEKATPRPWKWDGYRLSMVKHPFSDVATACGGHIYSEYTSDPAELEICPEDAALIVHAVNNIEAQEAEILRLRSALSFIETFAHVRSEDDSKVFARVNRGALRTIRDRASAALSPVLLEDGK